MQRGSGQCSPAARQRTTSLRMRVEPTAIGLSETAEFESQVNRCVSRCCDSVLVLFFYSQDIRISERVCCERYGLNGSFKWGLQGCADEEINLGALTGSGSTPVLPVSLLNGNPSVSIANMSVSPVTFSKGTFAFRYWREQLLVITFRLPPYGSYCQQDYGTGNFARVAFIFPELKLIRQNGSRLKVSLQGLYYLVRVTVERFWNPVSGATFSSAKSSGCQARVVAAAVVWQYAPANAIH